MIHTVMIVASTQMYDLLLESNSSHSDIKIKSIIWAIGKDTILNVVYFLLHAIGCHHSGHYIDHLGRNSIEVEVTHQKRNWNGWLDHFILPKHKRHARSTMFVFWIITVNMKVLWEFTTSFIGSHMSKACVSLTMKISNPWADDLSVNPSESQLFSFLFQ